MQIGFQMESQLNKPSIATLLRAANWTNFYECLCYGCENWDYKNVRFRGYEIRISLCNKIYSARLFYHSAPVWKGSTDELMQAIKDNIKI